MIPQIALDLLRAQFGTASRPQLIALGLTPKQVDGLVRRGGLECMGYGTYRAPGSAWSPEQACMLKVLRCRPKARLSGPAVLGLLRVEGCEPTDKAIVLVPVGRSVQNVDFTVLQDPAFDREGAKIRALPAVTATRAIIDSALFLTGKRLRTTIDSAKWRQLTSNARLRACARAVGHAGAQVILDLLDAGVLDQESEGERALRPILGNLDPPPLWQRWIAPDIRVDGLLADVPVTLEYLGEDGHHSDEQRRRDDARDRKIRRLGYHVEYFTKEEVRNPEVLRARVLAVRNAFLVMGRVGHPSGEPTTGAGPSGDA